MNPIKAMPIKMDGIYGVLEAVEDADEILRGSQYYVVTESALGLLNAQCDDNKAKLLSKIEGVRLAAGHNQFSVHLCGYLAEICELALLGQECKQSTTQFHA